MYKELDEAIVCAREVAEKNKKKAQWNREHPDILVDGGLIIEKCEQRADEYKRLAMWLEELKRYKAIGTVEEKLNNGWIPCSSGDMPEEHDSFFARFKGTDKWNDEMFEKISDTVDVTVVDENGNGTTTHAHTVDGKWSCDLLRCDKSYRIIAWQPLPEPYRPCHNTECCFNQDTECPAREGCPGFEEKHPVISNGNRIRCMNDKELAEFLLKSCDNPIQEYNEDICDFCAVYVNETASCEEADCLKAIVTWLQSEAK